MKSEFGRPDDRWERLLDAHACGELSEAERLELEELADGSVERRRELQLIHDLSILQPLETGRNKVDDQLIESVLAAHRRYGSRRKLVGWAGAAAVLIPLGAAAAYVTVKDGAEEPAAESSSTTQPPDIVRSVEAVVPEESPAQDEAAPEPPAPAAAPSRSRVPPPSATELLERAQKARSARNYSQAIEVYQQLLRRYPKSEEAGLAKLSLAQLQLAEGKAAAALAGFDAYQRAGGGLAREAHYGKIQALRALGRIADERAEIQRFLAAYPDSMQVGALKRRLEAADGKD